MDASIEGLIERVVDSVVSRRLAPLEQMLKCLVAAQPDDWVSVEEAAQVLGVTSVTVRRAAARGALRGKKLGKSWRIARSSLRVPTDAEVRQMAAEARR